VWQDSSKAVHEGSTLPIVLELTDSKKTESAVPSLVPDADYFAHPSQGNRAPAGRR
jgi:hypothetical protein